jgi:hypothetical protein
VFGSYSIVESSDIEVKNPKHQQKKYKILLNMKKSFKCSMFNREEVRRKCKQKITKF